MPQFPPNLILTNEIYSKRILHLLSMMAAWEALMFTGAGSALTKYILGILGVNTDQFDEFMRRHSEYSSQLATAELTERHDVERCLIFVRESQRVGLISETDSLSIQQGLPELLKEARNLGWSDPQVTQMTRDLDPLIFQIQKNWIDYDGPVTRRGPLYESLAIPRNPEGLSPDIKHGILIPHRVTGWSACGFLTKVKRVGPIADMENLRAQFNDISTWLNAISIVNPSLALLIQALGTLSISISKFITIKLSRLPLGSIGDYFRHGEMLTDQRLEQVIHGKRVLILGLLSTLFFRLYSMLELSEYFSTIGVLSDTAFGYIFTLIFILLSFVFPKELSLVDMFVDWYTEFQDRRKHAWEAELFDIIKNNLKIFGTHITFGQYTATPDNLGIDIKFSLSMMVHSLVPTRQEINQILQNCCTGKQYSFRVESRISYFLFFPRQVCEDDLIKLSKEIEERLIDIVMTRINDQNNKAELARLRREQAHQEFFQEYDQLAKEEQLAQSQRIISTSSVPGAVHQRKLTERQKRMARALFKSLYLQAGDDKRLIKPGPGASIHCWDIPVPLQKFLTQVEILSNHGSLVTTKSKSSYGMLAPNLGLLPGCNEQEFYSDFSKLDQPKLSRLLEKRLAADSGGEGVKKINSDCSISSKKYPIYEFKYDAKSQYRIYGVELNSGDSQARLIIFCVVGRALHGKDNKAILYNVIAAMNNQSPTKIVRFQQQK